MMGRRCRWTRMAVAMVALHVSVGAFGDADDAAGALGPEGRTIDPATTEAYGAAKVWHAKPPADAPVRAYRCRIVSYAGKWTRHGFSNYMAWRYPNGPFARKPPLEEMYSITHDVDVDGDGETADDYVASLVFSLTRPLSNPDWPLHMAYPERRSSRFYGGVSWYVSNSTPQQSRFWVEQGYNPDHSPPFYDPRSEDHPLQGQANEKKADSFHRHAWAILWRKPDFLNDGGKYRVTFDETSRLASICTRNYWLGYDNVRMIVQDGEQLYISDMDQFDIPEKGYAPARGRVFLLRPTEATWARYDPSEHLILFDATRATFQEHDFTDVRAVGWYLAKHTLKGQQSHVKWYGFEADAVVHRPQQGSVNINMASVGESPGVPAFYMATCELPYRKWKDINRYGDAPFHTLEARYVYRKEGDMGSMLFGEKPHGQDEPATNFPLYDALAICNTLSEMEGKTPCYYEDPEFKEVFRNMHIATRAIGAGYELRNFKNPTFESVDPPKVFVKWDADGHRLPTAAEWRAAFEAGRTVVTADDAWIGSNAGGTTHDVGSKKANGIGIHDMIGNVWEMVWTYGDVYDPAAMDSVTVLGGGFQFSARSAGAPPAASPYGDVPFDGAGNVGLRLVCREAGLGRPAMDDTDDAGVPVWTYRRGQRTSARQAARPVQQPVLDMVALDGGTFVRRPDDTTITISPLAVARTHTTYAQWKKVLQWGEARGYSFSKSGDMGSMYWYHFSHTPNEPVVSLTWHDMLVWCNALSEMEGRTPCYYTDEECASVYRQTFTYRPLKVSGPELVGVAPHRYDKYSAYEQPRVFVRWDTDGYRLPTEAEFEYALRGGTDTQYFWGNDGSKAGDYTWNIANAGGRSHPVGQKQPNPFGLYDIQGNVTQWLFGVARSRVKTRPYELDVKNPKASPYWSYKLPKETYAGYGQSIAGGGSFLYGNFNVNGQHGVTVDPQCYINTLNYYPDVGFRVVRCEAGTHPRDGLEELPEWPKVVEIDMDEYDPLEGAAFRGNLRRDGVLKTRGVPKLTGVKWTFDAGGPVRSSPVVVDGTVYVGGPTGFHALDAADGNEKWKVDVGGGVVSSACVSDGMVYFGGNNGILFAVDAATGELAWRARGRGPLSSSPAVAYGMVFMEGGVAYDAKTGERVWRIGKSSLSGSEDKRASSVIIDGDYMIQNGAFADIETARFVLGSGDSWAGQNCDAMSSDGTVFNTNSGVGGAVNLPTLSARDRDMKRPRWTNAIVMPDQPANERKVVLCSPATWDGKVYIGFDAGVMLAFDAMRGKLLWTYEAGGPIRSAPTISAEDGIMYFGSNDGCVNAVDARTGNEMWKHKTGGKVLSSPWAADGVVYVGSDDGKIYAIH